MDEELNPAQAAAYLGITTQRLSAIRIAKHEANEPFGRLVAERLWVYTKAELDAYKALREERPRGGRPPGSKISAAELTPSAVA